MEMHFLNFMDAQMLVEFVNAKSLQQEQIVKITQTLIDKEMRWVLFYYAE